jgi:MoaA/NifB/PqqE/SkfB family radical SAM enzyme
MMIMLIENCNFNCAHCAREEAPMAPGYRLSVEQLRSCLSDCRRLDTIRWVHFSGGEPTLWRGGNRGLIDLLLEISSAGYDPGFTTNGSFFTDPGRCDKFLTNYVTNSMNPLRLYLSIDTFHDNFDVDKGRARSLDNVIKCKQDLPPEKADLLDISVLATITKDISSLLPDEMIRYYESCGVRFGFVPLYCRGKAMKSLSHLCPDLTSDDPDKLGAYYRYHKKATGKKRDESKQRDRVDHIILIGDEYYFDQPWRVVARQRELPEELIQAYTD